MSTKYNLRSRSLSSREKTTTTPITSVANKTREQSNETRKESNETASPQFTELVAKIREESNKTSQKYNNAKIKLAKIENRITKFKKKQDRYVKIIEDTQPQCISEVVQIRDLLFLANIGIDNQTKEQNYCQITRVYYNILLFKKCL